MNKEVDGNKIHLNSNERSRHQSSNSGGSSGNRPPYNRDFRTNKPSKPTHDTQLKDAQENGKPVEVITMHGDMVKGNICNRDKYTITVLNGTKRSIIFKHAIEQIEIIQPTEVAAV